VGFARRLEIPVCVRAKIVEKFSLPDEVLTAFKAVAGEESYFDDDEEIDIDSL
jgi:hypothetical protein